MTCHDFLNLLNREVDGRTSPEEEALLMQHIGNCPACAAEQQVQHRIHHALQSLRSPACPDGLGARIADAVLSPASRSRVPASPSWARAGGFARQAAAILVTVALAGVAGWYLGQDDRPIQAGPPAGREQRALEHSIWVEAYRLPSATAHEILERKSHFAEARRKMPEPSYQHELYELETAEILRILSDFPAALQAYRRNAWISDSDDERLRSLLTADRR